MPLLRALFSAALRRFRWRRLMLGLLIPFCTGAVYGQASKEYQIKAAFLYNFTKFVEWPAERFAREDAPLVIGILGRNPFEDELAILVQGRKVNKHPIVVVQLASAAEIEGTHVVFIAAGEESLLGSISSTGKWPIGVLGVGESPRFATFGAVTFTKADDKVHFEINVPVAEAGGLKISAQLQKLARAVRRKN
jgi:hypothetical protein